MQEKWKEQPVNNFVENTVQVEVFKTQREFNNKFPSKFFICSFCAKLTPYKDYCIHCMARADGFLKTMGCGYKYIISEISPEPQEIFKPLELLEGE